MRRAEQGFTLFEVMIALTIFAVTASAISIANSQSLTSARQLEEQIQGRWVNQNVLTQIRLEQELLKTGSAKREVTFNGTEWVVDIDVNAVEMELIGPFLRHVELKARLKQEDEYVDSLIAVLGEASP